MYPNNLCILFGFLTVICQDSKGRSKCVIRLWILTSWYENIPKQSIYKFQIISLPDKLFAIMFTFTW